MLRHGHAKDNKVYLQSNIPNPNIKLITLPLEATFFDEQSLKKSIL